MTEYIITDKQLKTATEAYLEHELSHPITEVFISGDKLPKIVRCRDCVHASYYHPLDWRTGKPSETLEEWYCNWHANAEGASEIEPDGFCAWAERKEVGE